MKSEAQWSCVVHQERQTTQQLLHLFLNGNFPFANSFVQFLLCCNQICAVPSSMVITYWSIILHLISARHKSFHNLSPNSRTPSIQFSYGNLKCQISRIFPLDDVYPHKQLNARSHGSVSWL